MVPTAAAPLTPTGTLPVVEQLSGALLLAKRPGSGSVCEITLCDKLMGTVFEFLLGIISTHFESHCVLCFVILDLATAILESHLFWTRSPTVLEAVPKCFSLDLQWVEFAFDFLSLTRAIKPSNRVLSTTDDICLSENWPRSSSSGDQGVGVSTGLSEADADGRNADSGLPPHMGCGELCVHLAGEGSSGWGLRAQSPINDSTDATAGVGLVGRGSSLEDTEAV